MMLTGLFLILAIGLALSFEFVNGFHDTANAVATVIYTHTLRPWVAVIWSGCWNLIGVLLSGGLVAFTIVALLPSQLVLNIGSSIGFAMVFALLISAILWNLGTWYLGLPASSTHTLVGSIMGVGVAYSLMSKTHSISEGINWHEVYKVFLTLLVSPIVGFICSGLLLMAMKAVVKKPELYKAPPTDAPPPLSIRALLILTCTGVSFGHGRNDGQKGMGLILLILVGILPGAYALNMDLGPRDISQIGTDAVALAPWLDTHAAGATVAPDDAITIVENFIKPDGTISPKVYASLSLLNHRIADALTGRNSFRDLRGDEVRAVRKYFYLVASGLGKLQSQKMLDANSPGENAVTNYIAELTKATQYIPTWVKVAVAFALGLGTMVGWKRIVVTVGEKIGKEHLTYAQGASAELVAAVTIIAAERYGLPVSTTHVLSSGVAGTMAANGSGLQMNTVRNLLLAWVFTLPVCVILGACTFSAGLFLIFTSPLIRIFTIVVAMAALCLIWLFWRSRPSRPKKSREGNFQPTASASSM
jgi:PiT family inorganic phosphate transporter